jgi:dienelactone hydrolase
VILHVVDPVRTMTVLGRVVRRNFELVVRYPVGFPGRVPLIVFGHGFAVTPEPYARLLDTWAKAGYVVAAPIFPLGNANAPGGPNEKDLVNQPGDISLAISSLQDGSAPRATRIGALIDFRHIAVAGQSDGGDTALAVAYGPERDRRIGAAVILSGQEDPFAAPFSTAGGPPLLAVQGTADTINLPDTTYSYFRSASRPKYLLKLLGAGHLPPYSAPGRELATVERVTLAFLDRYLRGQRRPLSGFVQAGSGGPGSALLAEP